MGVVVAGVFAVGLSPILAVFIGGVLRRKLVVHQRGGACPPIAMTAEDQPGDFPHRAKLSSADASLGVTPPPRVMPGGKLGVNELPRSARGHWTIGASNGLFFLPYPGILSAAGRGYHAMDSLPTGATQSWFIVAAVEAAPCCPPRRSHP
jgi:hypothetical protein